MNRQPSLIPLAHFALDAITDVRRPGREVRPILGAEANYFFIQLCLGTTYIGREVVKIIHVEFANEMQLGDATAPEPTVTVPDASYMIALLRLLQDAGNGDGVLMHHPLDEAGEFLPTWKSAADVVIGKRKE